MTIKVFVFLAFLAIAQSSIFPSQPLQAPIKVEDTSFASPNYKFEYSVNDPHTGDVKAQQETRHGDSVKGSYYLNELDGTKRIVHYTADGRNGFNAVVQHEGHAIHPQNYDRSTGHYYHSQTFHPVSYTSGFNNFESLGSYQLENPSHLEKSHLTNGYGYLYKIQHHF